MLSLITVVQVVTSVGYAAKRYQNEISRETRENIKSVYFGFLVVCYGYLIDFWVQSIKIIFSQGETDSNFIHFMFIVLSIFVLVVAIAVVLMILFTIYVIIMCLLCCADCMAQTGQ